jgi:[acyl-carrier-protein] S-malonyltransferase
MDSIFERVSEHIGLDALDLIANGPQDKLNQTEITQPVLLGVNELFWQIYSDQGVAPAAVAGHSLGEFNALIAAGVLSFDDALSLVCERARLMQSAVAPGVGSMAAILGLPDDVVEALCREVADDEVVAPANYNSPGQLVVAGHASAVERLMLQAKQAGAKKTLLLPVSVPSHCALMTQAAEAFANEVAAVPFAPPQCDVIQNFDARGHSTTDQIQQALVQQLAHPVQWTATIGQLVGLGCDVFFECGPGRVLTGLGKRIERSAQWRPFGYEVQS